MKDITYDCLTLSALDLIETLENSPLGNMHVSEKQLKLLVRLLLQRLLISNTTKEVLKSMSSVLAVLCLRGPLKEMVIMKINQKTTSLYHGTVLPILMIVYFLGIEAVTQIFLPNINYFLTRVLQENESELSYMALAIYGLICKADYNFDFIHSCFQEVFGDFLVIFWRPLCYKIKDAEKSEIHFVNMKRQLIKTRRKVDCNIRKKLNKPLLKDVFEIPTKDCKIKKKIDEHQKGIKCFKRETHIIVGKTSLLLSVLKSKKNKFSQRHCDHSLLSYNF
ncbi:hypothetical protein NQ318_000201 [Aromia moschata]|uniref:Uncharacterized protein n=1 Tax=Aromia moschata TaxID=1265417 RepID=A0AAV8YJL1_9CUCU|nr:hypothetical protein NQ318_000201 [Aromia moschata]